MKSLPGLAVLATVSLGVLLVLLVWTLVVVPLLVGRVPGILVAMGTAVIVGAGMWMIGLAGHDEGERPSECPHCGEEAMTRMESGSYGRHWVCGRCWRTPDQRRH